MGTYLGPVDVHYVVIYSTLIKHICTLSKECRLTQKLNCKDYGIYTACCKNYGNYYVGQHIDIFCGLNIGYYGTDYATLKIMKIRLCLYIMINIVAVYFLMTPCF